jgi:hypothetical protein
VRLHHTPVVTRQVRAERLSRGACPQVRDVMAGGVGHTKGAAGYEVCFGVHVRDDSRERTPPQVRLKALCGPGGRQHLYSGRGGDHPGPGIFLETFSDS